MLLSANCLFAEPVAVTNEVWISATTTNSVGTGTLVDPYNGSGGNFDSWMRKWTWNQIGPDNIQGPARSNITIRLLPGTFLTGSFDGTNYHSTPLPFGAKLKGAGVGNTTLRLAAFSVPTFLAACLVGGSDTGLGIGDVYVADMTLDCNWGAPGLSVLKAAGLSLCSNSGTVERVKVINFGASGGTNAEVFPLAWFYPTNGGPGSITIQNCSVEGPVKGGQGVYATCIGIGASNRPAAGSSAKLLNNRVVGATNGIAYGASGPNVDVVGNFASGCQKGFHADAWGQENVTIRGNEFRDVAFGLDIGNLSYSFLRECPLNS